MKSIHINKKLFQLLLTGTLLTALAPPLLASPSAECRAEAQEYEIPPEQVGDYVRDCILSRGGDLPPVAGDEDIPAPEAADENVPDPLAYDQEMSAPQAEGFYETGIPAELAQ